LAPLSSGTAGAFNRSEHMVCNVSLLNQYCCNDITVKTQNCLHSTPPLSSRQSTLAICATGN
jgi:hypothetical protein